MSAVLAFWVLLACAVVAFFWVGWFTARLRSSRGDGAEATPVLGERQASSAPAEELAPDLQGAQRSLDEIEQLEQLEQRAREAEDSAAMGREELTRARQELAEARTAVLSAQDELAQLRASGQGARQALLPNAAVQSAQDETTQLQAAVLPEEPTLVLAIPPLADDPRSAHLELAAREAELRDVRETAAQLEQRVATTKVEARRLAEQLALTRFESQALGAQRDRLTVENTSLTQEIRSLRESQNDPDAEASAAELRELRWRVEASESRACDAERVLDENAKLAEELRALRAERGDVKVVAAQAELRELRLRVHAAEQRGTDLEQARQQVDELTQQLAELGDVKEAQGEAKRLRALNKQLVLETVAVQRRLDELRQRDLERQEQVAELATVRREAEEVETLRAQVRTLEAQLFALAPSVPPARPAATPGQELGMLALPSIDPILAGLLASGMAKTAVVADRMGLLVAGAGDRAHQEGLAAMGAMAEQLAARARENLPVTTVRSVCLTDSNDLVMGCRPLAVRDGTYTLCTLGVGPLSEEEITRAGEAVIRAAQ